MEINNLNNNLEINNTLIKDQRNFMETVLGKTINTAIDVGIRALLPNFLEEQIINIKDNLFNYGLKEGINKTIDDAIDLGKSALGIFTGKFDSIEQMQKAVKTGGIIDGMSSLIDIVLNGVQRQGIIDSNITNVIRNGKNILLNNIESNIEKTFENESIALENTSKYISNWRNCFENKDFNGMERAYKRIEKQWDKLAPIEKTLEDIKKIKNIHNLIKNNGENFNLSEEELELAEKFK